MQHIFAKTKFGLIGKRINPVRTRQNVHVDIAMTTYLPHVDNCGHLAYHLPLVHVET